MRIALVGFLALLLQGVLASFLQLAFVLTWFETQAGGLKPEDKADYLSGLFDAPLPLAFALSLAAFPAGAVFVRFSGALTQKGLLLFSTLVAVLAASTFDVLVPVLGTAVGAFLLSFCGGRVFRRNVQPADPAADTVHQEEQDFDVKVRALEERQRTALAARREETK